MTVPEVSRVRRFTAVAFLLLGLSTVCAQQLTSTDSATQETARNVSRMMPRYHLNRVELDDRISSMLLNRLLKDIDPLKLYFLKSDVDEFEPYRNRLDDLLKEGNVDFAYMVFDRFKQRVAAQSAIVAELLKQEPDYSLDEFIESDGKKLTWCASQEELNERWRLRIKYDLLQAKLDGQTDEAARERLQKRYRNNKLAVSQYNLTDELEIYLTALCECFDPHSSYMSPNSWENFEIQMRLSLDGIGAALKSDDGFTVVASIVPGGAAAEDGRLKVGDKITAVGQGEGELVDIFEMRLDDVVRMIRGERGSVVRLQVKPQDGAESKMVALTRKRIELKESEVKGRVIDAQPLLGRPGKVGVISLPSFYRDFEGAQGGGEFKSAAADLERVLDDFAKSGEKIDAVVVDLRFNGGGALTEAVEVTGKFIDRGPVVQIKDTGNVQSIDDRDPGARYTGPLIVLCNRLSASASEIFAGAIRDYHRGIVIGDTTTHGKGTVQNLMDVAPSKPFWLGKSSDRGKLKLTIQQFYRVNGDSTQNRGVRSDIVLPSLIDHGELGEEFLENALPFNKVRPAQYSVGRMVDPELINLLSSRSQQRVAQTEDFQKLQRAIDRFEARKSRTLLPLNEEQVKAERVEDEIAKKEEKSIEGEDPEVPQTDKPVFPENYYNNEVLHIALDYAEALAQRQPAPNATTGRAVSR